MQSCILLYVAVILNMPNSNSLIYVLFGFFFNFYPNYFASLTDKSSDFFLSVFKVRKTGASIPLFFHLNI